MPDLKTEAVLKHNFLFRGLCDATIAALAGLAHRERFSKGSLIFSQGDPGDALYGVASGRIRIYTADDRGHEVFLNELGPGETFGEIALLDGLARTASAMAIIQTTLVVIPRAQFLRHLEQDTGLSLQMMKLLCERLRWVSKMVEESALLSGAARVATRLSSLVDAFGTQLPSGDFVLTISQAELAHFLGISRQVVNQYLGSWADCGWVTLRRGKIIVHDLDKLKAQAAQPH